MHMPLEETMSTFMDLFGTSTTLRLQGLCFQHYAFYLPCSKSWVFIGRTDVEAETPILWPPDGKSWLIGKDTDAGKDWRQEEKGMTEDEMVGWHHQVDGREFE